MTPADIERVFGRSRLRMVTGEHVEVFREESRPGERRRYTKRFLATPAGDFSEWTEREWRILARLVGHGIRPVPDVVQFDRGAAGRPALVQTYDAGITVDHWATLLPLTRDGRVLGNVFEDCAHWWALARHCLIALDAIHELQLVHLDLKADNICIPVGPASFDPGDARQALFPRFEEIALIDFAFSLVSGETLETPLPIAHQADYVYQSPRLLQALDAGRLGDLRPTQELDWRCDLFSLAAMLWRYLPELEDADAGMWTPRRHAKARALVRRIMEAHDAALPAQRPHAELIEFASERLSDAELSASLQRGWMLAIDHPVAGDESPTPVTQIAPVPAMALAAAPAPAAVSKAVPEAAVPDAVVREAAVRDAVVPDATGAVPQGPRAEVALPVSPMAEPMSATTAGDATATWQPRERIEIDRSDVAEREALHRQRQRASRSHVGWAAALALVAVSAIGVALWGPLHMAGSDRAATPVAASPATIASAPTMVATAPALIATAPAPAMVAVSPEAVAAPAAPPEQPASPPHEPAGAMADRLASKRPEVPAPTPAPAAKPEAPATPRKTARLPPSPVERKSLADSAAVAKAAPPADKGSRREAPPPRAAVAVAKNPAGPRAAAAKPTGSMQARAPARVPGGTKPFGDGALLPRPGFAAAAARPPAAIATPPSAPRETAPAPVVARAPEPDPVAIATVPRSPAPVPVASAGQEPSPRGASAVDFGARASELLARHVPRLAQRAERHVSRVLFMAGRTEPASEDEEIVAAVAGLARTPADPLGGMVLAPQDGRRLNEAGEIELLQRGHAGEALRLHSMAFGANPLDAEVAGDLARVLLRQRPAQAEAARQLALHALTLGDGRPPQARVRDWTTLAIASALAGRERDARNAWLVTLALSPNVGRQCKAAIDAYASWGERLRGPVEAMLERASASGRADRSAFCEWPPHWVAASGR